MGTSAKTNKHLRLLLVSLVPAATVHQQASLIAIYSNAGKCAFEGLPGNSVGAVHSL